MENKNKNSRKGANQSMLQTMLKDEVAKKEKAIISTPSSTSMEQQEEKIEASVEPEEMINSSIQIEDPVINEEKITFQYLDYFSKREKEELENCRIPAKLHGELKKLALIHNATLQHIVANCLEIFLKSHQKEVNKDKRNAFK